MILSVKLCYHFAIYIQIYVSKFGPYSIKEGTFPVSNYKCDYHKQTAQKTSPSFLFSVSDGYICKLFQSN